MEVSHYYGNSVSSQSTNRVITSDSIKVYYSYETIIAVEVDGVLTIAKNIWSSTTGKHLNAISRDKSIRVDYEVLEEIIDALKITIGE